MNLLDLIFGRVKLVPPPNRPAPGPATVPVDLTDAQVAAQLLTAVNAERQRHGLKPVTINGPCLAAARAHAKQMAKVDKLSHEGIGDDSLIVRLIRQDYAGIGGENVAWNYRSVPEVVAGWMRSPGHRANVLGDYADFGGAAAAGRSGLYWCVVLGKPFAGHSAVESLARLGPASQTHAFASEITQAVKELGGWV